MKKILFVKKKKPFSLKCTLLQNTIAKRSSLPISILASQITTTTSPNTTASPITTDSPITTGSPNTTLHLSKLMLDSAVYRHLILLHDSRNFSSLQNNQFPICVFFGKNPNFCNFTSIHLLCDFLRIPHM